MPTRQEREALWAWKGSPQAKAAVAAAAEQIPPERHEQYGTLYEPAPHGVRCRVCKIVLQPQFAGTLERHADIHVFADRAVEIAPLTEGGRARFNLAGSV